jgi:hypothetical protein
MNFKVGTYSVYLISSSPHSGTWATIKLQEESGKGTATLFFIGEAPTSTSSGGYFPVNYVSDNPGPMESKYNVYYPFDEFSSITEMLREEQSVIFYYDMGNADLRAEHIPVK